PFSRRCAQTVNPVCWLVDWNRWNEYDGRMTGGGFVRLGTSSWEGSNAGGWGPPLKQLALGYAQAIGADVVLYALHPSSDKYDWTSHEVAFYARTGHSNSGNVASTSNNRPSSESIKRAMNRIQDILHKPRIQSEVLYDEATDSYSWIGPEKGKPTLRTADDVL